MKRRKGEGEGTKGQKREEEEKKKGERRESSRAVYRTGSLKRLLQSTLANPSVPSCASPGSGLFWQSDLYLGVGSSQMPPSPPLVSKI